MVVERILWNRRGEDIDEIVLDGVMVHVEQMHGRCWWIGVYRPDGSYWMGNFVADATGAMRFVEQENNGIVWESDTSHQFGEGS